jgi:hypothetical protein
MQSIGCSRGDDLCKVYNALRGKGWNLAAETLKRNRVSLVP